MYILSIRNDAIIGVALPLIVFLFSPSKNPEPLVTNYFLPLVFGFIVLPEEVPFAHATELEASLQDVGENLKPWLGKHPQSMWEALNGFSSSSTANTYWNL